ncbi:uncharacterized protein RSE6_07581 [Rhynchosporium secalis]|uniref:C6 finger domain protein n=1 Tax=Rhynchosporium secalis TaxID=38038 RepID=A0A1E1MDC2_RHYSE|nr:uncharacterized protein RSE6_07581 [Rhynchosporium secalis]
MSRSTGMTQDMLSVFEIFGAMTKAIQHYLDGEPKGLTHEVILRTRYDVQHRILSLPPITDLPVLEFPFTYEACRLGGLIYSIAVLLPIPNSYLVLKELVQQLQTAIEMSRLESPGGIHADIHLWLGGIAALDKPERYWYVRELVALVRSTDFWEWSDVDKILERYQGEHVNKGE